jgi:hypothetical protein
VKDHASKRQFKFRILPLFTGGRTGEMKMIKRMTFLILLLVVMSGSAFAATPSIDLGSGSGSRGTTVQIPITLTNVTGTSIASIGMDIGYDTNVLGSLVASIGPAGSAAGKSVSTSTPSPGVFRIGILGFNTTAIGEGVVAYVTFTINANANFGATTLANTPSASDQSGNPVIVGGANGSITVQEQQNEYTLILTKSGTGSGTVTSSPAGINCGSDCTEDVKIGKKITLTAKADANSTFTGWSGGNCSGTGKCVVVMNADTEVTAAFSAKTPAISVSPDSLDFGGVKVGKKITKTLKIADTGSGNLVITLSGLDGTDFGIQGSSSVTIKAKGSYSLKVLFTPKSTGSKTATLKITSNDPNTPILDIPLSGTGQ